MSDESFQKHIDALAAKRLEKPKKLSSQNAKYWSEIISQHYNFDRGTYESTLYVRLSMLAELVDCN